MEGVEGGCMEHKMDQRWRLWRYKVKRGDGDHEKTGQKNIQIRKLLGYG